MKNLWRKEGTSIPDHPWTPPTTCCGAGGRITGGGTQRKGHLWRMDIQGAAGGAGNVGGRGKNCWRRCDEMELGKGCSQAGGRAGKRDEERYQHRLLNQEMMGLTLSQPLMEAGRYCTLIKANSCKLPMPCWAESQINPAVFAVLKAFAPGRGGHGAGRSCPHILGKPFPGHDLNGTWLCHSVALR